MVEGEPATSVLKTDHENEPENEVKRKITINTCPKVIFPEEALNDTEIEMPDSRDNSRPAPIEVKPKKDEEDYFHSK